MWLASTLSVGGSNSNTEYHNSDAKAICNTKAMAIPKSSLSPPSLCTPWSRRQLATRHLSSILLNTPYWDALIPHSRPHLFTTPLMQYSSCFFVSACSETYSAPSSHLQISMRWWKNYKKSFFVKNISKKLVQVTIFGPKKYHHLL